MEMAQGEVQRPKLKALNKKKQQNVPSRRTAAWAVAKRVLELQSCDC